MPRCQVIKELRRRCWEQTYLHVWRPGPRIEQCQGFISVLLCAAYERLPTQQIQSDVPSRSTTLVGDQRPQFVLEQLELPLLMQATFSKVSLLFLITHANKIEAMRVVSMSGASTVSLVSLKQVRSQSGASGSSSSAAQNAFRWMQDTLELLCSGSIVTRVKIALVSPLDLLNSLDDVGKRPPTTACLNLGFKTNCCRPRRGFRDREPETRLKSRTCGGWS
jgi:hypothetical protein